MKVFAGVFCLVLVVACGACNHTRQDRQGDGDVARSGELSPDDRQGDLKGTLVTGTVRHIDLEGGFYGIETDDGAKLDPVDLPAEFRQDGLRVRARVEPLKDRVSFRMWGSLVRVLSIERLGQGREGKNASGEGGASEGVSDVLCSCVPTFLPSSSPTPVPNRGIWCFLERIGR